MVWKSSLDASAITELRNTRDLPASDHHVRPQMLESFQHRLRITLSALMRWDPRRIAAYARPKRTAS
jgi:hypothetical protein